MFKKIILVVSSLLFAASIFAASGNYITNNKKPIVVNAKNATFTIKLMSNATTGYSWLLSHYYPNTMIRPISRQYVAPNKMMPGAAGYELWTFKVTKAGFRVPQIGYIQLIYARSWEVKKGQVMTFEVVSNDS
ncbi:MAG: protease inhibitor I42 family protein [Gammaproteobacteria bacterium]|nr:protease inhibitor I42 family protein [Gammaproteobacteria bacterium]